MTNSGSNLLNRALQLIGAQEITYLAFTGRTVGTNLMQVPSYATPVLLRGSIQAVPRALMEILGLDMQRNYVTIFVPSAVLDIARDVSSDKFQYGGRTFQGVSSTDWYAQDAWMAIICVQVPS